MLMYVSYCICSPTFCVSFMGVFAGYKCTVYCHKSHFSVIEDTDLVDMDAGTPVSALAWSSCGESLSESVVTQCVHVVCVCC